MEQRREFVGFIVCTGSTQIFNDLRWHGDVTLPRAHAGHLIMYRYRLQYGDRQQHLSFGARRNVKGRCHHHYRDLLPYCQGGEREAVSREID